MDPKSSYENKINQSDHQITVATNQIFMDGLISSEDVTPIVFWNDKATSRMMNIQNNSERKFTSSTKSNDSWHIIKMDIWISYHDNAWKEIYSAYLPLKSEVMPTKNEDQNVDLPVPNAISGTIEIYLHCVDKDPICNTERNTPWKVSFEKSYAVNTGTQIAIVDTTFDDKDDIEIENFRRNFNAIFGLSTDDSEKILKSMYSKEAIQEKKLWGAVILGNPNKYAGDNSPVVRQLKTLIKNSYSHLTQEVVFLPYDSVNFGKKTHYLSECKVDPKWCRNNMAFLNLDPYKNHFSHSFFDANPNLDFLIIIPTISID